MIRRLFIFVFTVCFFFTGISYGQGGKIQGTVKMQDGTPLPGVTISIEGTSISTITDRNGFYSFAGITRGMVTLVATLDGFKQAKKEVVVSPAMTLVVDITLEMAPLSEETTVEAERPLLSISETVSMVTLTPKQIETLPSLGERDIFRNLDLCHRPAVHRAGWCRTGGSFRGAAHDFLPTAGSTLLPASVFLCSAVNPSSGPRCSNSMAAKTSGTKSLMWWKARSSRTTSCTWD